MVKINQSALYRVYNRFHSLRKSISFDKIINLFRYTPIQNYFMVPGFCLILKTLQVKSIINNEAWFGVLNRRNGRYHRRRIRILIHFVGYVREYVVPASAYAIMKIYVSQTLLEPSDVVALCVVAGGVCPAAESLTLHI